MSASRHGTQIFLALLLAMLGRSAEAGRPVLDLANPPDGKGRFELSLPSSNLSASGYWWKRGREDGYTTFQIDEKLVDAAIGSLLSERKRYEDFDPRLVLLQQGHYAGNEYQFTLQDVLALVHVLPDMGSVFELLVAEAGSSCRDALREARTRVDDAVDGLRPSFVSLDASRQEWRLPLDRLGPDLVALQKVVETDCNSNGLGEIEIQDRSLRFERVLASGKRRLSIYDTRAPGEPSGERLVAEMVIWKDGAIPPPPADPAPTSVVDPVAIFRLKVHECRGLPWEFSDFAASDTWIPPEAARYLGPTPLSGTYACRAQAFASVETWGAPEVGKARAKAVFEGLREAARLSEPSAGVLPAFQGLFDGVEMQERACLRLATVRVIGPRRFLWEATREEIVEPDSLEPSPSGSRSGFAAVTFPEGLMRQFDAILDAAAERGFEAREDVDVAGRRHVDLATVEPPTLPTYRLSLSLTATVSSTGSIRVRYDFHLGTPCLLDPVGGDGFRERGASG